MGSGRGAPLAAPPPPLLLAKLPALARPDPLLVPTELPAKDARAAAACCLTRAEPEGGGVTGPFFGAGASGCCCCWLRGCLGGAAGGAGVSFLTGLTMSAVSITPPAGQPGVGSKQGRWVHGGRRGLCKKAAATCLNRTVRWPGRRAGQTAKQARPTHSCRPGS